MIPFKVKIGFLPSVWSGPSLGAVSYSCSPAGEGPPPHILSPNEFTENIRQLLNKQKKTTIIIA